MTEHLLNPAQQRFVLAILEGKTQVQALEAYKNGKLPAGTAEQVRKAAKRVHDGAAVQGALAHARAQAAAERGHTTGSLVAMLERAYEVALGAEVPQANAAVAAAMGIGKLLGLVVDRKDVTLHRDKPALLPVRSLELSEDEWKRSFVPGVTPRKVR